MQEIEKLYARTFLSPSGQEVIKHLRKITVERFLGADATDSELRGLEAQRALVHQIEMLIERGK